MNYESNCQLKVTHLLSKTNLFLYKNNFIGSYKTIEEHYAVIFQELSNQKGQLYLADLLQNWYIYILYTLKN